MAHHSSGEAPATRSPVCQAILAELKQYPNVVADWIGQTFEQDLPTRHATAATEEQMKEAVAARFVNALANVCPVCGGDLAKFLHLVFHLAYCTEVPEETADSRQIIRNMADPEFGVVDTEIVTEYPRDYEEIETVQEWLFSSGRQDKSFLQDLHDRAHSELQHLYLPAFIYSFLVDEFDVVQALTRLIPIAIAIDYVTRGELSRSESVLDYLKVANWNEVVNLYRKSDPNISEDLYDDALEFLVSAREDDNFTIARELITALRLIEQMEYEPVD